jgi:hypothetical protein
MIPIFQLLPGMSRGMKACYPVMIEAPEESDGVREVWS